MAQEAQIIIHVPAERLEELDRAAEDRGFDNVEAYLLSLIEVDLADDDDDPTSSPELLDEFRQAWQQAQAGNTRPLNELRADDGRA